MRAFLVGAVLVLLAGSLSGCEKSTAVITATRAGPALGPGQILATNASVRLAPVETGCWLLDTPQGTFVPTGLPLQYQRQGLAVHVVLRGDTTAVSLCMMEPMVSVDSIGGGWR